MLKFFCLLITIPLFSFLSISTSYTDVISVYHNSSNFRSAARNYKKDTKLKYADQTSIISKSSQVAIPDIPIDAVLSITELIPKYGYPLEVHKITTSDEYILTIFRIPFGRNHLASNGNSRPAVLLMHGISGSSDDFIVTEPRKALGYILADEGYDVWLGNVRGTKHSKEHVFLSPNQNEFWNFTLDEIAQNDLTAMIDYILIKNEQQQLYYIGHSQGTTLFLMMCAKKKIYNAKIALAVLLAPVVFVSQVKNPLLIALIDSSDMLHSVATTIGNEELMSSTKNLSMIGELLCNDKAPTLELCLRVFHMVFGYDADLMNSTALPVIWAHAFNLNGFLSKQFLHYSQMYRSNRFCSFDHGQRKNLKMYGSFMPPKYNLKNIKAPVMLAYGANDQMSVPKDVETLYRYLPNASKYLVPFKNFNHIDFLWATNVKPLLYNKILKRMKNI